MKMTDIPFGTTDWSSIEPTLHKGDSGVATWRTRQFGDIRVRLVEYSPGYIADHWCQKGHILFCVDGELGTDLADGRSFTLTPGMPVTFMCAANSSGSASTCRPRSIRPMRRS